MDDCVREDTGSSQGLSTPQRDNKVLFIPYWSPYSLKCAGGEIHSFRSHIGDHFILERKIVESTLKRVIQPNTLEWIPLFGAWISTPKQSGS